MRLGLLVFFAAGTLAAPFMVLDDHLPRAQLKDGCKSLRFPGVGTRYTYDYAGETINKIASGPDTKTTGIQMKAKVAITAKSRCSYVLEIFDTELLSKSSEQNQFVSAAESAKFKKELEEFDLLFDIAGENDQITSLRAHQDESVYFLNIKRGILSALQMDYSAKTETDVHGICEVSVEEIDGKVVKTKDLSKCEKRGVNEIGIHGASIQRDCNMKPLASTSKCAYEMVNTKIDSVVCEETHLFRPFSAGYESPSGAMTTTKQTLKQITAAKVRSNRPVTFEYGVDTTLIYDYSKEELNPDNSITSQFENVMDRLVDRSRDGNFAAKQESAHEFANLVKLLRKMDNKRMMPIWQQYFDCIESKQCKSTETDLRDIYRQYLLDAVTYCGTSTCISVIHDVILRGDVSGERMNMFLQGITLVGKTSMKMIGDVLDIVKRQPSRQAFLTLGTLLSRHCRSNEAECHYDKASPVTQAELLLERMLGQQCATQTNADGLEAILMALKSIGNAGRPLNAFHNIIACGRNSRHNNLTVAAFDALRSMPCSHDRADVLLGLVSDEDVCPEKRIHAFRALMKCPDEKILHRIVHRLEQEPSKQLGSFMYTHLSNIMESSDPKHETTRALLEKLTKNKPLKEINMPFHQFSRSFEKSFHLDSLKSGATAEGHLIFNPNSYLPKSGFANFTANIMGVPINIVETAIQVDGIETLLEDLAGPDGVFPDNSIFNFLNFTFTKEQLEELTKKRNNRDDAEYSSRQRRGVVDNLTKMHEKINKKRVEPSGSISFKVMGQEVRVFSYDDIFWAIDKIDNMNVIQLLLNVAKGGRKTFSKSMLFLEFTHSVPTGLGMPLRLKLTGSTVSTVELEGKFDIRNMFWGPSSMQITGFVRPSAVVELSGEMGIDGHFVSTGLFVNSSMFASQTMKGGIIYKEGQLLKVNLDVPEEPVQLFNFSSTPFLFMNEESKMIEGAPRKISPDFCLKSKMIGLGMCTSFRVPVAFRDYEAPYFPLSGPAHFGVKLIKADEKLTTYQLMASLNKVEDRTDSKMTGQIVLNTPGATYERNLNAELRYEAFESKRIFVIGTTRNSRRAEWEFNYDVETHSLGTEVRCNMFTKSDVTAGMSFFNLTKRAGREMGIRMAAGYDWYQFEHETKYTAKRTGPMVSMSTTYYPKKTITSFIEYNKNTKKVTARLDANPIKQSVELTGQMTKRGVEKGITITGTHVTSGKAVSLYGGIVNTNAIKKLILSADVVGKTAKSVFTFGSTKKSKTILVNVDAVGKEAELKAVLDHSNDYVLTIDANVMGRKAQTVAGLYKENNDRMIKVSATAAGKSASAEMGYYQEDGSKLIKMSVDVMDRKAEVFAKLVSAEGHRLEIGGVFGKYRIGGRTAFSPMHGHGKSLCSSLYYDLGDNEVEPFMVCAQYDSFGSGYAHQRLTFSADLKKMNKKVKMSVDLENHEGHASLKNKLYYNDDVKCWNNFEVIYAELTNGEIKMESGMGDRVIGMRAFSAKKTEQEFGFSMYYNRYSLALINKYSSEQGKTLRTEILVNEKPLPVSTSVKYFNDARSGVELTLFVGKYSFSHVSSMEAGPTRYYRCEWIVKKNGEEKLNIYKNTIVQWSAEQKSLEQQFGIRTLGRTYQYGYTTAFMDKSTISKTAYAVKFTLAYSTTRSSSVTFTFANSKQTSEVHVNVEYLPGKIMSHIVRYTKASRQLDVTIEFLPRMFVKFTTRLDKNRGMQLTSDLSIEWAQYKRAVQWVNSYTNTRANKKLSSSIGKFFELAAEYKAGQSKSVMLSAKVMSNKAEVIGTFIPKKKTVLIRFVFNKNEKFGITGFFNRRNGKATLDFSAGKKLLSFNGFYVKRSRKVSMSVYYNKKAVAGFVAQYKKVDKAFTLTISASKSRPVAELIARYDAKDQAVFLKLIATKLRKDIGFAAKWNKDVKSVTFSAETGKHLFGTTLRADWVNFVLASHVFYNDHIMGVQAHLDTERKNFVYNVTLTPTLSAQVIFEVLQDRILKMTVQRKIGTNVVDEAFIKYTLTRDMCNLAFNWNKDTINRVRRAVTSAVNTINEKARSMSKKAMTYTKDMSMSTLKESAKKTLMILNSMDKAFDDFDFIAARNKIGEVSLKGLKQLSVLTRKGLNGVAFALDTTKEKLPELISQTTKLVKSLNGDLRKNLKEMTAIIAKVAKNLTESTRPVVNKAIALVKDFKIRGEPVAQIVSKAWKKGEEYVVLYVAKAKARFEDLKVQAKDLQKRGTEYILKVRIPYRKETVEEVIKIIIDKATELRNKVDLEKKIKEIKVAITTYKLNGKTFEEHYTIAQKKLKDLPESTRKAIHAVISASRKYLKDADEKWTEVKEFAEPLTDYADLVSRSVQKHFGPVYKKAMKSINKYVDSIEVPSIRPYLMKQWAVIETFFLPLIRPLKPMYTNIADQVRALRVMGIKIGPKFDKEMQAMLENTEEYMRQANNYIKSVVTKMNGYADTISRMSPEQMVDNAFDASEKLSMKTVEYMKDVVAQRKALIEKASKKMKALYSDMKEFYNDALEYDIASGLETAFVKMGNKMADGADELSSIVKQLAALNLADPAWKAWTDADLLGHLASYGVNGKIESAIASAKKFNVTFAIQRAVKIMRKYVNKLYGAAFMRTVMMYNSAEKIYAKVFNYLRSIPKKEYEAWFNELKEFAMSNKEDVMTYLERMYGMSKEKAQKLYEAAMKLYEVNYDKVYQDFVVPSKQWYTLVSKKANSVYDDIRGPTIDVKNHYEKIARKFFNEKYEQVYQKAMQTYNKIYKDLKKQLDIAYGKIETAYNNFLDKHGDKTWEEVYNIAYELGEEKFLEAKMLAEKEYKKMMKTLEMIRERSEEYYGKAMIKYEEAVRYGNEEVKPKVIKMYKKYMAMAKEEYEKYYKQGMDLYKKAEEKAIAIYEANKYKTLRQLYEEGRDIVTKFTLSKYNLAKEMGEKKVEELKTLAQKYYQQADVLTRTILLPELKKEAESIINQTLRASVEMGEITAKSFYPHYVITRDAAKDLAQKLKVQLTELSKKVEGSLKDLLQELLKLLRKVRDDVKNSEYLKKVRECKTLGKAKEQLNKYIEMTKEHLHKLNKHPKVEEYKEMAKKTFNEYSKLGEAKVEEVKTILKKYSNDERVLRALDFLKKLKKSGLFTYKKLQSKLEPLFDTFVNDVKFLYHVMPLNAQEAFNEFRKAPEESFWTTYNSMVLRSKQMYATAKGFADREVLKELAKDMYFITKEEAATLLDECTDKWAKDQYANAIKECKSLVQNAKSEVARLRREAKKIPAMIKAKYEKTVKQATAWAKKWEKKTNAAWERCPYNAFVRNQIWGELAEEFVNHELVALSQELATISKDKATEMYKDLARRAIDEYNTKKAMIQREVEAIKTKMEMKFNEMKEQAIQKYNKLVAGANKFFDETRVIDIVDYTTQKIKETKEFAEEMKETTVKTVKEYRKKAEKMLSKYERKLTRQFNKYYSKAMEIVEQYKAKAMPYYKKAEAKVMEFYNKYYPQMMAKYEELYKKAEAKYKQLRKDAENMYHKLRKDGEKWTKETKESAMKMWMESEVRSQMMNLKKMTIRETIDELKALPAKTRKYATKKYNEIYSKAEAELRARYTELRMKADKKYKEFLVIVMPTYIVVKDAADWVNNEITETAIFVYRYYRLADRYNQAKDFIVSEAKRIAPMVPKTMKSYYELYRDEGIKQAKHYASKAGHGMLRGIHSSFVYMDSIDTQKMRNQARSYFTAINKYITIDSDNMIITISIPHGGNIKPSFSHHIKTLKNGARRVVRSVKQQSADSLDKIKTMVEELKQKAIVFRAQMMEKTAEYRQDLMASGKANNKIIQHLYKKAQVYGKKYWKKAISEYKDMKTKAKVTYRRALALAKTYLRQLKSLSADAYTQAIEMSLRAYQDPVSFYNDAVQMAMKYRTVIEKEGKKMYNKYAPIAKANANKYYGQLKTELRKFQGKIRPYVMSVKLAVRRIMRGVPAKVALKPLYRDVVTTYRIYSRKAMQQASLLKKKMCRKDLALCNMVSSSYKLHKSLFNKYADRATDVYYRALAQVQRVLRVFRIKMSMCTKKDFLNGPTYKAAAMIFGKSHVLTFDQQYYQFVDYKRPTCTYVLARDFVDGKFTVMTQKEDMIIKTPDMKVKIGADGMTETTIDGKTTKSLPVQSGAATCKRMGDYIKCYFMKEKFMVVVDLKHFIGLVSVSGWHYGKSQGLLGTNNRESFDDWKLPNGKVSSDIYEVANAYEVTGVSKCQVTREKVRIPPCNKRPSRRCAALFKDTSSPFAAAFDTINMEAFLRACEADTSDCKSNKKYETSHCDTTAAFVMYARATGHYMQMPEECTAFVGKDGVAHKVDSTWTQKPLKRAVDVVVLMSERTNVASSRKLFATLLGSVNERMQKKYNVRFALIGFGGHGVHEKAHIHPLKGEIFTSNIRNLKQEITAMPYTGVGDDTNDAYHAILKATQLSFRPGASRAFIMYNTVPHSSHEHGPSFEETMFALTEEANATLFVFDKLRFKNVGKRVIIGQTARTMYTNDHKKAIRSTVELPASEFKEMVEASHGGLFTNKIKKVKRVGHAVFEGLTFWLDEDSQLCKSCRAVRTWYGAPRAVCQSRNDLKC